MNESIFNVRAFARLVAVEVAHLLEQSLGDDILNTEQAAALLKLHPDTVTNLANQGKLPARKIGRDWRYVRSQLLQQVREGGQSYD